MPMDRRLLVSLHSSMKPRVLAPPRRPSTRPRHAFTVLEVLVTTLVLVLGLYTLTSTVWRVYALRTASQDRRVAENALRAVSEEVRAVAEEAQVDPASWAQRIAEAFLPGGVPGDRFDVRGLEALPGQASVGSVRIVLDETLSDADLGAELGMPRDLDGDGAISNPDVSLGAMLLPVVVRVQWRSAAGRRETVHAFYLLSF
jgi:hypothetical protein